MINDFIPQKDYNLIKFTKDNKDIIKKVKKYSMWNCRKEIEISYITKILSEFDYGIAYFRTEMLKINRSNKNRPCAFAYMQHQENKTLYILLICAIHNNDNLGTKILNEIFLYAHENSYNKIALECDEKNKTFYEKFDFLSVSMNDDDMFIMKKNIE